MIPNLNQLGAFALNATGKIWGKRSGSAKPKLPTLTRLFPSSRQGQDYCRRLRPVSNHRELESLISAAKMAYADIVTSLNELARCLDRAAEP